MSSCRKRKNRLGKRDLAHITRFSIPRAQAVEMRQIKYGVEYGQEEDLVYDNSAYL